MLEGVPTLRQKAELRVIVVDGSRYALIVRATLDDEDLYCAVQKTHQGEALRQTYHKSGKRHTYVRETLRLLDDPSVPLRNFAGREKVWGVSPDLQGLDWSYKPKSDSPTRSSMILNLADLPEMWSVELWCIEKGRQDLVSEMLSSYPGGLGKLQHVLIDWTQPQLLAIALTLAPEVMESLKNYAAKHLPPGGTFEGFVLGPAPPGLFK